MDLDKDSANPCLLLFGKASGFLASVRHLDANKLSVRQPSQSALADLVRRPIKRRETDLEMDSNLVNDFLLANQAGKISSALANPPMDVLQKAQELYVAHQGRLPSPAPPEPLQPSEK